MEYNKKKKSVNGYNEGYNYPAVYYSEEDYGKEDKMPKVEGSFWIPLKR